MITRAFRKAAARDFPRSLSKIKMRLSRFLTLVILLSLTPARGQDNSSGKSVDAKAVIASEVPMGWTTQAILSTYVGPEHAEGYMDLLIPLLQGDNGMIFLYPRFGLSSDVDPGYSLGLGARHYIPAIDAIIGGNVFFDRYGSPHDNYYDQLGLGVEVLTRWVDARFNYYIPDSSPNVIDEQNTRSQSVTRSSAWGQPFATGYSIRQPYTTTTTTTTVDQLFERFEDSMEGFDAEVGVLTPWLEQYVALRWFAGYYDFGNSYGDDVSGFKGRAELRLSSKLAIDATYYEDEAVVGDNWLFGFRVSIPVFMENLADGRSPFEGSFSGMFSGVNLSGRNRESGVLRGGVGSTYPSSYAALSPFAAMAPAPSFAAATGGGSRGNSVRDRMTEEVLRLSGARTSESDFIENLAKREVDVDVDTVTRIVIIDPSVVFVNNRRGTSRGPGTFENPLNTIQGGVNRASTLFGNAGDVFVSGTGRNYVEDVMDAGSSVRIWGGARGYPARGGRRFTDGSRPVLNGGFLIDNVPAFLLSGFTIRNGFAGLKGVHVVDVRQGDILWNKFINVGEDGIHFEFFGTRGNVNIIGNTFVNTTEDPIDFDIEGASVVSFFIDRNQAFNSGSDGMTFDIEDTSVVNGLITNNLINGFNSEGIEIDQDDNSRATIRILSNRIINGNGDPLDIDLDNMSFGRYQVANNVFAGVGDVDIDTENASILNLQVFGNTSSNDFDFDEFDASTFLMENTLGTNMLNGGAIFDIDASIPPYVPFGTFGFPSP